MASASPLHATVARSASSTVATATRSSPSTLPYPQSPHPLRLAWSSDGQQIFATSEDGKIRSTGSQRAELQLPNANDGYYAHSIALAPNGKFIATFADRTISLLDTSTLTRISPVIEGGERIWSIAISSDGSYLATGQIDGEIIIYNINDIPPGSHGPSHASICRMWREDEKDETLPAVLLAQGWCRPTPAIPCWPFPECYVGCPSDPDGSVTPVQAQCHELPHPRRYILGAPFSTYMFFMSFRELGGVL